MCDCDHVVTFVMTVLNLGLEPCHDSRGNLCVFAYEQCELLAFVVVVVFLVMNMVDCCLFSYCITALSVCVSLHDTGELHFMPCLGVSV